MADQDFNIKVVTTADTTGIRQTSAELDKLKQQQATFAETARRQAAAAATAKPVIAPAETTAGFTGTAIGLSTIVTLLTASLSKWREFNAEQDKWVEGMIKSQEKSRELGLSVADMLDAMKSAERIDTEPLQVSFDRLTQKVTELKTEMNLAFGAGEYEDVKRIAAALGVVESQLNRVTAATQKQAAEAGKEREKQQKAQQEAYGAASPQAQAILTNEQRAAKLRESGDQRVQADAAAYEKTAEALKRGATPAQLAQYEQLKKMKEGAPSELSDIEKNKKAYDEYWNQPGIRDATGQMQPAATLRNPPPNEDMIAKPVTSEKQNQTLEEILSYMKGVWGPM